jgi:hypothetical protein
MPPLTRLLSRNQYAPERITLNLVQFGSLVKWECCGPGLSAKATDKVGTGSADLRQPVGAPCFEWVF